MLIFNYKLSYDAYCDTGDFRKTNQDRIFSRYETSNGHSIGLFAVADGCGGMTDGEKISQFIVDCLDNIWVILPNAIKNDGNIRQQFMNWISQINMTAYDYGVKISSGVGSTMSILLIIDRRYYIFNVGDSRVYLRRKKKLHKLTEDQSKIADMLRNGEITEEEAELSNKKNILTMCVGYYKKIEVFQTQGKLKHYDLFLLCSDGLYREVRKLENVLPEHIHEGAAEQIRKNIKAGYARDNVSVVLVEAV